MKLKLHTRGPANCSDGPAEIDEWAIARLLSHRFGDRLVYLLGGEERPLLNQAMSLGLVSDEGYLTTSGYQFWQQREACLLDQ